MTKTFAALWTVSGLFVLGLVLVLTAAFTTHTTRFAGEPELYLKFQTADRKDVVLDLSTVDGAALKPDESGYVLLRPRFETRETNVFDTLNTNGPLPRTAIIAFKEAQTKSHEIQFTYDRNGRVWQAVVAFPDPTISHVEIVNSSLDFKGLEGEGDNQRRHFESTIYAKAIVGPPIVEGN
jgi:hypothetical protein